MACVYTDWCKLQGERLRLAGIGEKCSFFVFLLAEGLGGWGGGWRKKKKMVPLCRDLGHLKSAFLTRGTANKKKFPSFAVAVTILYCDPLIIFRG